MTSFNLEKNKGFTLLELLVVIAIIGILASVVMVTLQSTKNKADVAYVVSSANEIKNGMDLYYSQNGTYRADGVTNIVGAYSSGTAADCPAPFARNGNIINDIVGKTMLRTNKRMGDYNIFWCAISPDGQSYAFAFEGLKTTSTNTTYCIDSSGSIKQSNLGSFIVGDPYNTSVPTNLPVTYPLSNPVSCR